MAANPIPRTDTSISGAWPKGAHVVLDGTTYTPGSRVRFRLILPEASGRGAPDESVFFDLLPTVFRAGRREPISRPGVVAKNVFQDNSAYETAWRIPEQALSGRYSLSIGARDRVSGLIVWKSEPVSFAIWRAEIVVEDFSTDRRFYAPGDPVTFTLALVNRTAEHWKDLSVEVGESQYPWISAPQGAQPRQIFRYAEPVCLAPGESRVLTLSGVMNPGQTAGSLQYTVTVRSKHGHVSRNGGSEDSSIVAFRTGPAVFLRTPGSSSPVYPAAYIHCDLSQVRVEGYRSFYSGEKKNSWFENHTSYRAGEPSSVRMKLDSKQVLRGATLELRSSSGELVDRAEAQREGSYLRADLQFGPPGLYTVVARVGTRNGGLREVGRLEVAANILPRSLAVVCAHPDDEFLHPGIIRAAVENSIPVHLIYLTNGDAGGSDRFFGANFTPAEAIEFGHIRMAEARAAAQHLGVPSTNLHFLGLPDGFLEAIRIADESEDPIPSPLLGSDHAPYSGVDEPNLPFQRRSVLKALARLLSHIDPDVVYTSHPDERHSDHSAAARLTIESLRLLLAAESLTSVPILRADQFYGPGDSIPAPFSYRSHEFFSSGEAMARVQEAYWYYQTQGGNHARGHVLSYADLPRVEHHQEIVNWEHTGA